MVAPNKILQKMLDRLLAGLVNGPGLNCRPYASRQRLDLVQLGKLGDVTPENALRALLGPSRQTTIKARTPIPKNNGNGREKPAHLKVAQAIEAADEHGIPLADGPIENETIEETHSPERAWFEQQAVLNKLHTIAEDARTYEQDTGVSVLNIGFPLLSLPAGTFGGGGTVATRRVLAPLAFIPIGFAVKRGAAPAIELTCKGEGVDLIMPNSALLAWIEQQTGKPPLEMDGDESGERPWREICQIVQSVCKTLDVELPEMFKLPPPPTPTPNETKPDGAEQPGKVESDAKIPDDLHLESAPKADDSNAKPRILCSAVLGLFPMANQGLLRDMQWMLTADNLTGPIESFIRREATLNAQVTTAAAPIPSQRVTISDERFVSGSDPCQARAVRLARESRGLVVHGPPGTGKSQTITNIIGDHLARGQRVLVVCDKRTALDVVFNRLSHMGLGNFCALVHDPRRDQRELYKAIRQQLDDLSDANVDAKAEAKLANVDAELQSLHDELSRYRDALVRRGGESGLNFHELVGQWLTLENGPASLVPVEGVTLKSLNSSEINVLDVLRRADAVAYGKNPWTSAAGISLAGFLAQSMKRIRSTVADCDTAARAADDTYDPAIPPFAAVILLREQSDGRLALASELERLLASIDRAILYRWAKEPADGLAAARRQLDATAAFQTSFREGPFDAELLANVRGRQLDALPIGEQLVKLAAYQTLAKKWYSFLPLRQKSEAAAVLSSYGLTLGVPAAERLIKFITALRARLELTRLVKAFSAGPATDEPMLPDDLLEKSLVGHRDVIALMTKVRTDPAINSIGDRVAAVLQCPETAPDFINGLRKSPPRASALQKLEQTLDHAQLFDAGWLKQQKSEFRLGQSAGAVFVPLLTQVETFEGVLRVRQGLGSLPSEIRTAVEGLIRASVDAGAAGQILHREALATEISDRLKADVHLHEIDGQRLSDAFSRYRQLDGQKRELTRAVIQHRWISRQQERLLAGSKSRLNSLGADLRRRLMLRGERAMRLRQVVKVGQSTEGGDPLFDICPIWLCSPETVAQVFACEPVFDVLVFDEASQLRLEEALPVLVRGKRVVIAGDPKQLPPTRFFESAVAASEDDDVQSDQDLFEQQQGEVEDLLGAALGLDIQQCHLDVHYRSRNADLIAFSNEQFYNSRLQPIPGHPSNAARAAAVELEQVGGVYDRRRNDIEADRIVAIVKELLERPEPPSIGIACFNLVQRDLVAEKLDDLAAEEPAFAKHLEKARARQGEGSFEGLFVKNLENVQGDERDYILISTTYGPDRNGKFYRRFGPLGRSGGGRRLNVLVTRAEKVHVITSIPREAYRSLPQPEAGQTPGGTWLLLAYLKFAESLATPGVQPVAPTRDGEQVHVLPTRAPSSFAQALAKRLAAEHGVSSDVHWGNEGFCIDLALRDTANPRDVSVGVLCDAARFAAADDPMQWDIFRTGILEDQGWTLRRIWTPHFYRDPEGVMRTLIPSNPVRTSPAEKPSSPA